LKLSDSARYGGFCQRPCAPWFQEESWKMAYPRRIAVFELPIGFHEIPIRGSIAVLSSWMPTRAFEATQIEHPATVGLFPATSNCPVVKLKFAWRFWASVSGVTKAQAIPRFKVRLFDTRQS